MKSFSFALRVFAAACYLVSCTPKESNEDLVSDSTDVAQGDMYDFASLPANFGAFLANFPIKPLPARFPSDETYSEGDLEAIDEALVQEFLPVYYVAQDPNQLYYVASLRLHPDLYSVLVYHVGEMGAPYYMLANFSPDGALLSTRTIAYAEAGGGMTSSSSALFEQGGMLTITDLEEGVTPDSKEENTFTFQVNPTGAILPAGIPSELITSFHNAVVKKGEYLIAPAFGYSEVQLNSRAFEFSKMADSTLFSPYDFFEVNSNGLHDLIIDSFTKTAQGYRLTLKELDYPHDLYDALTHITLNSIEAAPGAYQMVFSVAGADYAVVTAAESEFVIAQTKLSAFKTRELPFIDGQYGLSTSGGLNRLRLETSSDEDIVDWAKEEGYTYKKDNASSDPEKKMYHSVFERQTEQVVVQAVADKSSRNLVEIILYSPKFKTDGGIGIGSTVGELLYAHEGVTAICGENVVIMSVPAYKHAQFIVSHVAGAPDSEVDVTTLDEKLEIVRVDFRLD